ncbi:hypothetical protein BDV93DRAFT_178685 [Ceratobasidium sp. AG-I]|nr:hypothetical protein BDV93DRAFT_178685 [Ceratobasidium sp. AG-I]
MSIYKWDEQSFKLILQSKSEWTWLVPGQARWQTQPHPCDDSAAQHQVSAFTQSQQVHQACTQRSSRKRDRLDLVVARCIAWRSHAGASDLLGDNVSALPSIPPPQPLSSCLPLWPIPDSTARHHAPVWCVHALDAGAVQSPSTRGFVRKSSADNIT